MRPKMATQVKKNVGLCPCIFCRETCSEESSSVECSSCKGWIHWSCVPMTYDLLKEWGEGNLPFTCRCVLLTTEPTLLQKLSSDDDTAAVANISDNGTVDYDEDEADDYDDDAVDKDGHFVSTEPDILPGRKSLPLGRFL
ncbi:hypothetical protein PoB_002897800 [Plakobranchus ocellatus]|uniref:Zinc finger PHD-type domain-containing protein n=1 Tax=Plakobranchus ocellatus TaxID=259542 RepID=A0AAV4A770_9GAST|nr:hypothetical protein PoB_002897800 [Plakobranchus ocellatus]